MADTPDTFWAQHWATPTGKRELAGLATFCLTHKISPNERKGRGLNTFLVQEKLDWGKGIVIKMLERRKGLSFLLEGHRPNPIMALCSECINLLSLLSP